jgi:hypothetical protein
MEGTWKESFRNHGRKSVFQIKYYRADGVAQVVEHLPSKCEALSSKP